MEFEPGHYLCDKRNKNIARVVNYLNGLNYAIINVNGKDEMINTDNLIYYYEVFQNQEFARLLYEKD